MLGSSPEEKRKNLIRMVGIASEAGVEVVVLDSERAVDDLKPADVEAAAEYSDAVGGPVVAPTIPVRRSDFGSLLPSYLEALSRRRRMGLCIVAGNPAYLSVEEASVRPGRLLWFACRVASRVLNGRPLLLGTENVEGVSRRICSSLGCTAFLLLDEGVEDEARTFAELSRGGVAVYAPFFIGEDGVSKNVERVLVSYARRRKRLARAVGNGSVGLREALRVSLVGGVEEVAERISTLASSRVNTLVGFPAELSAEQLGNLVSASRLGWRKG
ncbi:MAG: hypothetical protein RMJ28_07145 [Nitrososphaerota archaeon]|nr:hypothetical protein [Candidatus Calditenuaceae archaeon]MDW8073990.1 hypothetical protein [Nitrososphaerota archaeon]